MEQQKAPTCGYFVVGTAAIAIVAIVLQRVAAFFNRPDALQQIVQCVEGLGLCLGVGVAFVALVVAYSSLSDKIAAQRWQKVISEGRPYSVRCHPVLMEKWADDELPEKLAEEPGQESKRPFDFILAMTNHGPCIMPPSAAPALDRTNPNVTFPLGLFSPHWSEPVFIALERAKLYYLPYQPQGNVEIELAPAGSFGYTGKTPAIPAGHEIALILLCRSLQARAHWDRSELLDHPMLLKLVVLDRNGRYDLRRTCALYKVLQERIRAYLDSNDDSWAYRSRPIYW